MVIKAAIFDMDGLLIDSERIIMQACISSAKVVGIDYTPTQFVELIGRAAKDSTRIMTAQLGGEANFNRVMQGLDAMLVSRQHQYPIKHGVKSLLAYYQTNQVVCSVASSSAMHHIEHRLNRVGITDYFTHFTSGQEVENGKPAPDIYLLALEKLGLCADQCIAFEDSEQGARAAIAAGLKVVVVPDLIQPSDYVRENSHLVIESLAHFLPIAQSMCIESS